MQCAGGALLCPWVSEIRCAWRPWWGGRGRLQGGVVGRICGSRTAILAEDVRILQITGVPPQWSGGEVSPRAGSTFPIRCGMDSGVMSK